MAENFRIISQRKKSCIRFKLKGDFDGMSAMELIYALKENIGHANRIYIETEGLYSTHPFGREVFKNNFHFSPAAKKKIVFTGSLSRKIAPKGTVCMNLESRDPAEKYSLN